jgi:hypothetical protein
MAPEVRRFLIRARGTPADQYTPEECTALWRVAQQTQLDPRRVVGVFEEAGRDPDRAIAVINGA